MTASRLRAAAGAALLLALGAPSEAAPAVTPDLTDVSLRGPRGDRFDLAGALKERRLTVVTFFSATCPCFAAHRARLDALARELEPRGVRFLIVDSERHDASGPSAAAASLALPVLRDEGGRLARRLGARFATESFVLDAAGAVRYRGGIDADRTYLRPSSRAFLRDALLALVQGAAPPATTAKTLGCALRLP